MKPLIKNIIIFSVILILVIAGYMAFFRSAPQPALVGSAGSAPTSAVQFSSEAGKEFLSLLLNIRSIKLDDAIFSNPAFNMLQDYTIILVPEGNEGRLNPFAPIGVDTSLFQEPAPTSEATPAPEEEPSVSSGS